MVDAEMQQWIEENSQENGNYATLADHELGEPAWYTENGTKDQIGLMITARAGACILKGNKTRASKATYQDTLCPHCDLAEPETETHLLVTCPCYSRQRLKLLQALHTSWSQSQRRIYLGACVKIKRKCIFSARG